MLRHKYSDVKFCRVGGHISTQTPRGGLTIGFVELSDSLILIFTPGLSKSWLLDQSRFGTQARAYI